MSTPHARSRYRDAEVLEHTDAWGRTRTYHDVRLSKATRAVRFHLLREGERLDHVAYRYLRDPEVFWRICDANDVPWPATLEQRVGQRVAIPGGDA